MELVCIEVDQTLGILDLEPKGVFRIEYPEQDPLVFDLPTMTPLVYKDALTSGLLSRQLSHRLMYLIAKTDSYNSRLSRFLLALHGNLVIPVDGAATLHENWSAELRHIEEQKEEIRKLCREVQVLCST